MHLFIVPDNHAWPLFVSINQCISVSNKLKEAHQSSSPQQHHTEEYSVCHWPQLVGKLMLTYTSNNYSFCTTRQLWWQTSQCCMANQEEWELFRQKKRSLKPVWCFFFRGKHRRSLILKKSTLGLPLNWPVVRHSFILYIFHLKGLWSSV